ncbi:hypothetical protein FMM56_07690 [Campylobacter sp. LR264d]|uniref:hypothetical protein n=1 Tax=Campylobacter sp. LR264d TaxID=2593544 RepID=UPI00123A030C|nr:hypothetical protein [Campylobacter sp. LR264d]KAA6229905.1 hypothetical protein FMM56_07690 [Campylobacter sp. LR264d]
MLEDDFLKEKQNIREKMLKYSRAISQGKPLDDEFNELSSDDILRRRFKNRHKTRHDYLDDDEEFEDREKKSNIYLKEDLINVKLEERQSLTNKIFTQFKKKKDKTEKQSDKKRRNLFGVFSKNSKKDKNQNLVSQNTKITTQEPKTTTITESEETAKILKQRHNYKKEEKKENIKETIQQKDKLEEKREVKSLEIKQDLEIKENNFEKKEEKIDIKNIISNSEENENAKNTLLESFSNATKEDANLNLNQLLFVALFISFVLFLFVPQIYIRNNIYYLSREIAVLRNEESVLNEENKELKRRLENMRFKNQILDYLE